MKQLGDYDEKDRRKGERWIAIIDSRINIRPFVSKCGFG